MFANTRHGDIEPFLVNFDKALTAFLIQQEDKRDGEKSDKNTFAVTQGGLLKYTTPRFPSRRTNPQILRPVTRFDLCSNMPFWSFQI